MIGILGGAGCRPLGASQSPGAGLIFGGTGQSPKPEVSRFRPSGVGFSSP